ncbi:DUF6163 family protein [Methylobacterium gnaphalii]|uniref:DoxX family protein n=1 Tax=Methylobacterium gnaphalii TaxID=1010610 RepID=A0A512JF45_9HYPH|nr:DUF6163 family protein [Methylobacterium gnaphalii]GEP08559.1 hypothetical protein MGN01_04040 [Methylobacterium gnaphalii]GJD70605.1 hypothetical protein MMMDOFMJ_3556 [Methylobacterium gnaphalii]GLS50776.1 hypothetical protein GCM10007885_36300 [Methylobacterium gnaphalii]
MKALTKVGTTRDGRGRLGSAEGTNDRIERAERRQTHWDTVLVWFMRIVALVWVGKGVLTWADIVDVLPGTPPFESEPIGRQTVMVYFAVIDFTAAVGLWLTSAWGGVVWLLAATSGITLAVLTPQLLPMPIPLIALQGAAIIIYFTLSWLAARENQ